MKNKSGNPGQLCIPLGMLEKKFKDKVVGLILKKTPIHGFPAKLCYKIRWSNGSVHYRISEKFIEVL